MSQTPNRKNIVHGSITAGGSVHIGDIISYTINEQKLEIPVRLTNFIPTDASHVVGRDDELAETHQKLSKNKPTVLVNGIGGIGKTTLALKYMVAYTPQYQHVAWLNAAAGVQSAFIQDTALLDALHLKREVEDCINAAQPDKAFDLVFKRLNDLGENTEGGKKILVVLDNANELPDLLAHKKYFDTAHSHFLITSRANPEGWQMVKVESLPKEQALELFKNIYPSVSASDEALDTVLGQLFYHTLLIELVAKAAKANAMDFDRLRQAINDKFIHDPDLQKRKVNVENHSVTIGEEVKRAKIEEYIWLIFKNVKDLPDTAKEMLRAFALLPPALMFNERFLTNHFSQWQLNEAIFNNIDLDLVERGWLEKNIEKKQILYSLHPLISDVIVRYLGIDIPFASDYIRRVANSIRYDNLNPEDNLFEKKPFEILGQRLIDLFHNNKSVEISYLLHCLNGYYRELGLYQKAIKYGKMALQIIENIENADENLIPAIQNDLALALREGGQFLEAIVLLENALAINEKQFGKEHTIVANRLSNLATVYHEQGRNIEAEILLKKSLAIEEKNFGIESPKLIKCLNNLAQVYQGIGIDNQAVELLERSLFIAQKSFQENHPNIASCQSNLASAYCNIGRYEAAVILLKQALIADIKNFGLNHPHVANRWFNLAKAYQGLSRHKEAAVLLEKVLTSDRLNYGDEHPSLAITENNLAFVYLHLGKKAKAYNLWLHSYIVFLKIWGETHPNTQTTKQMLDYLSPQYAHPPISFLSRFWSLLFKK